MSLECRRYFGFIRVSKTQKGELKADHGDHPIKMGSSDRGPV